MQSNSLIIIFLLIVLGSCELIDMFDSNNMNSYGSTIDFTIKNNNNIPLNSLMVYLSYEPEINTGDYVLESNDQITIRLDMENATEVDGSYTIKYMLNGESQEYELGYYTNGYPLDEVITLVIDNEGCKQN